MKTYQDLVACGVDESRRMDFIIIAMGDYKSTPMYRDALNAQAYARKQNITINNYRKLLYNINGEAVPDNYSANHKCASAFFPKFVMQEVQYLLGNGATFEDDTIKTRLESKLDFDSVMQKAARYALVDGVCYGFFNLDHIDLFRATEFAPLFDEENGSIKAGIRWWQVDYSKPLRCTLYELDGYTDYIRYPGKDMQVLQQKRPYKLSVLSTEADGTIIYDGTNYPSFPIVPLYGNDDKQSELVGLRETIDCYDLILSGFANDLDEASMLYWTLENCGGMDDIDLVKFKQRMSTIRVANLDNGDDGAKAESHAVDVPYQSREVYLSILEKRLYDNAMAFNPETVVSGSATATQIRAAYTGLNLKCNDLEYRVDEFIRALCVVAGIEPQVPTFQRDNIVNVQEEVQSVMMAAQYLDDETLLKKLPFISTDEIDEIMAKKSLDAGIDYDVNTSGSNEAGADDNTDN